VESRGKNKDMKVKGIARETEKGKGRRGEDDKKV
jgi:hypothetical protein